MFLYEIKKIINFKTLLCFFAIFFFSCIFFFVSNKGVKNASNTRMLQKMYREVQGEITKDTIQKMEAEKTEIETVIADKYVMEEKYNKGEVEVDAYLEYRDLYHECENKRDVFDLLYEHYLVVKENGWHMVFDSYYNQLFRPTGIQWGLILSIIIISMLLANSESAQLVNVLCVTRKGKKGVWYAKLKVVLFFSALFAILYSLSEYGIAAIFSPFAGLNAPVQSIGCLENAIINVSIGEWIILTGIVRVVASMLLGSLLLVVQSLIKNSRVNMLLILLLIIFPMILAAGFGIDKFNIISKFITVYPMFLK